MVNFFAKYAYVCPDEGVYFTISYCNDIFRKKFFACNLSSKYMPYLLISFMLNILFSFTVLFIIKTTLNQILKSYSILSMQPTSKVCKILNRDLYLKYFVL